MAPAPTSIPTVSGVLGPDPNDAITLVDFKQSLGMSDAAQSFDTSLQVLITGTTRDFIIEIGYTNLIPTLYAERRDGMGRPSIVPFNVPVISVQSILVNTYPVPPSPDGVQPGWVLDPATGNISIVNSCYWPQYGAPRIGGVSGWSLAFVPGRQNILLNYIAGFGFLTSEPAIVPTSANAYQSIVSQAIAYVQDFGVVYAATGNALLAVPLNPQQGQYSLVAGSPGVYQFNAADSGAAISILYTYKAIPFDIAQAVKEWCTFRWNSRQHYQFKSEGMAGQSTTYERSRPESVAETIERRIRRWIPN